MLVQHAETELMLAARDGDMAVEQPIREGIVRIIEGFAGQGHSGGSASIVGPRIGWIVGQLLAFEPITPLTGEDGEWVDVTDYTGPSGPVQTQQNRRCSDVFRERRDGGPWVAYRLDRAVWTDWPFARLTPGRGRRLYELGQCSPHHVPLPAGRRRAAPSLEGRALGRPNLGAHAAHAAALITTTRSTTGRTT
jgi:hypothetical protein